MKLEFYFDLETTGNVWKCLDLVKSYLFRIYYWCRIGYVSVFLTYCVYMITVFQENFNISITFKTPGLTRVEITCCVKMAYP